ncbi:acyl-coenzyme A thioesterase THEM4-like [Petromyzon marinus]|uniref:acyl-coenzyme A thioesterase THEM4-like n=1 Tax=Petromyzon marinus TaxID=7757 RepID=UPI003F718C70
MLWPRTICRWAAVPRILAMMTRPRSVPLQSQRAASGDAGDPAAAAASPSAHAEPHDYSLPNSSWTERTMALYRAYLARTPEGGGSGWTRLPSYNRTILHEAEYRARPRKPRPERLLTRNTEVVGAGFEYAAFHSGAERRTVCIFQPGPLLEGFPGFVHGGALAALIDGIAGTCARNVAGMIMTANLNIDYRSPVPLGSTVLLDACVTEVDGKKVYTTCRVLAHDESAVHTDCTALFIVVDEVKIRHLKEIFLRNEERQKA